MGRYDLAGTGHASWVFDWAVDGILDWAQQHRLGYLCWQAHGTRWQRFYDRIVRAFAARSHPVRRLEADLFTG